MKRASVVIVALVGLATVAMAAPARVTVGTTSFTIPKGWSTREGTANHATITKADKKNYCLLSVYAARAWTGDLDSAFDAEWKDLLSVAGDAPTPTTRKVGTRSLREGGMKATIEGNDLYASAHVTLVDNQTLTIVIYSSTQKGLTWCRPDMDTLIKGVQIAAAAPAANPPANPAAPANPAPPTTPAPAGNVSVTLAELAGKWANNGAATTSYVDSAGNYSGTSTTFFGEWYTVKADGSYTFSFQGRANNHTIRETGAGKISFSGDLIIIDGTRDGTKKTKKYHLINYQVAADGTGVLTLLDESYPTGSGNVALYKEVWIKNPTQKK